MTDPILTLEAPLLFNAACKTPDYSRFVERLNDRLGVLGLRIHQSQAPMDGTALFSARDFHVLISPSDAPLPADSFAAALASPVSDLAPVDFAALVAEHSCHLGVSVGDGPFLKTKEMIDLETKLGILEEVKPADLRLKTRALHLAVLSLLDVIEPKPTAIHWRPSDMLHTPESFRALPESDFPGALVFTPEALTHRSDAQRHPLVGFTARGAEAFCGRDVVLEPAPFTLQQSVELVADLIARHANGAIDLGGGGEFALSPTVRARITEGLAGDEHPEGYVSVALLPAAPRTLDWDDDAEEEPERELALAEADPAQPAGQPGGPAAARGRVMKFAALRSMARARERKAQSAPAAGVEPPATMTPAPEPPPQAAPEPELIEPEVIEPEDFEPGARVAAQGAATSAMHRLQAMGLDRVYNPEPGEGMLKHILVALAIVLVAPVPGFILLIVTLIHGPMPKLTFVCALIALATVLLQATSYLSLFG